MVSLILMLRNRSGVSFPELYWTRLYRFPTSHENRNRSTEVGLCAYLGVAAVVALPAVESDTSAGSSQQVPAGQLQLQQRVPAARQLQLRAAELQVTLYRRTSDNTVRRTSAPSAHHVHRYIQRRDILGVLK